MFLLRKKKSGYPKECIMFAEKTDSESSCSFFGKRKAITRKNALCLRRKRTRKAVVPSSEKEKRLSERMHYVCGENGLGKQLSPLRKRKAVIRKNELHLRKIRLETPRRCRRRAKHIESLSQILPKPVRMTPRRGRPLFVLRTFFPFHRENSQVRITK